MAVLGESWQPTPEGVYPKRILLLGPTGSGKTTAGVKIAPEMAPVDRIIPVSVKPDLTKKLREETGDEKIPWHNVSPYDKRAMQSFFSRLYESPEHLYIIIDDFDLYSNFRDYDVPALHELVRIGRGYGKGMMMMADGTSSVPKTLIGNSDLVLFYRTTEPNLLDYAERYMDDFPGGPKEARWTIENLHPHTAIVWAPPETPKFKGWLRIVNGQLMLIPPDDPEAKPVEESVPEEEDPGPASIADDSSAGDPGASIVRSTTPAPTGPPRPSVPSGTGTARP